MQFLSLDQILFIILKTLSTKSLPIGIDSTVSTTLDKFGNKLALRIFDHNLSFDEFLSSILKFLNNSLKLKHSSNQESLSEAIFKALIIFKILLKSIGFSKLSSVKLLNKELLKSKRSSKYSIAL